MQVKDFTLFSFSSCAEVAEVMQAEEAMVMKTVGTKVIGSGDGEIKSPRVRKCRQVILDDWTAVAKVLTLGTNQGKETMRYNSEGNSKS